MPHRYKQSGFKGKFRFFTALREKLREGYGFSDFRADLMSGAVVGLVAIPLAMALAIASGVAPQAGLYTVVIAGMAVALLGGSRFQVTGPTAAFVVILAPITHHYGLSGLLIAGLMAGILLLAMGFFGLGYLIQFIPHPVTTGFTSGIAVVIATIQLKDFFGLQNVAESETYFSRLRALYQARSSWSTAETAVAISTLSLLVLWPKIKSSFTKKIPAPLVALGLATVAVLLLKKWLPDLSVATIGSRFSHFVDGVSVAGIPQSPPSFVLPWRLPSADGTPIAMSWSLIESLIPAAFAIAILGAIESLLSAVVADGLAGTRHDPNAEIMALGAGNILCPFFGGIAATGAIARTATNIRYGAKSPFSAVVHALFTLIVILAFAPYVSLLPMSALAALLVLVAYNISDIRGFMHIVKVAPRSDVFVLVTCFALTVVFDMVIGVSAGIILSAVLFMHRMSTVTSGKPLHEAHDLVKESPSKQIMFYEIAGPLFFGAGERAVSALQQVSKDVKMIIFLMESVPHMDITGLVALESAVEQLHSKGKKVIFAYVQEQPAQILSRSRLKHTFQICRSSEDALETAKKFLE